jgi:hypothetical protein
LKNPYGRFLAVDNFTTRDTTSFMVNKAEKEVCGAVEWWCGGHHHTSIARVVITIPYYILPYYGMVWYYCC